VSPSRPRAVITVGGQRLTSAEAALVWLRLALGPSGTHDLVELMLWPTSRLTGAAVGAPMSVALGEDGGEQDVWAGQVTAVEAGPDTVAIEGLAATVELSRRRVSQTYLNQSVADIVRSLVPDSDEVSGDTQLPAYSLDDRRSVWTHLLDLAAIVGADVGASPSGTLRFVPPRTGSADATLRHGADILSWRAGAAPKPVVPAVAAYGAGSEAGAEQWHWILRAPAAGGEAGTPLQAVAALRTRDAADAMTRALTGHASRAAAHGRLRVVGRPDLRPGALVAVTGLPSGDPGMLRVLAVEHVLDTREGFVTVLTVEGAGA
jgi:hypothetical protein